MVGSSHRLARRSSIQLSDVRGEALLMRSYCEYFESLSSVLRSHGFPTDRVHEMPSERDLKAFLQQDFGVAFVPQSMLFSDCVKRVPVTSVDLRRNVSLYGVAGRHRTRLPI